jgi:hypothetical protein
VEKNDMKAKITADKALLAYTFVYNTLTFVVAFLLFILFIYIVHHSNENVFITSLCFWILAASLLGLIGHLSFAFHIWKFWAFSRVENVHELKKRLILLGHITKCEPFLKKIENCTHNNRRYWEIHRKFAEEPIFVDDKNIADETVFYNSIVMSVSFMMLSLFLFVIGIVCVYIAKKGSIIFGIVYLLLSFYTVYFKGFKKLIDKTPKVILNSKGITTYKTGFYKWEDITNISVDKSRLYIKTKQNKLQRVYIYQLNIKSIRKFSKLIMVYMERNNLLYQKNIICI